MNNLYKALFACAVIGLSACDTGPTGSAGFTLPKGDVERGKEAYIAFGCNSCHDNASVPQATTGDAVTISIPLGGESARVRTYGELVTSVINPSHRIARRRSEDMADGSGKSRMVTYNDVMTVAQLIDLVAFISSSYDLAPHKNTVYPVYWYPETAKKKD